MRPSSLPDTSRAPPWAECFGKMLLSAPSPSHGARMWPQGVGQKVPGAAGTTGVRACLHPRLQAPHGARLPTVHSLPGDPGPLHPGSVSQRAGRGGVCLPPSPALGSPAPLFPVGFEPRSEGARLGAHSRLRDGRGEAGRRPSQAQRQGSHSELSRPCPGPRRDDVRLSPNAPLLFPAAPPVPPSWALAATLKDVPCEGRDV